MPRPRHRAVAPARHFDLLWTLRTGLCDGDGFSDEDLRVGWDVYGEALMEERHPAGTRPWGWWAFVVGEPRPEPRWNQAARRLEDPHVETARLAELGELTPEDLAALREDANEAKLRVGTDSERISGGWRKHGVSLDQQAVELWETVESTVGAQRGNAGG